MRFTVRLSQVAIVVFIRADLVHISCGDETCRQGDDCYAQEGGYHCNESAYGGGGKNVAVAHRGKRNRCPVYGVKVGVEGFWLQVEYKQSGDEYVSYRHNADGDQGLLLLGEYLYYKGEGALVAPIVYENATQAKCVDKVETDYYVATFAQDGSFESIVLKENGKVALTNANKLRVFVDKGDSWDFMDDYREQPELYMQLVDSNVNDFGDLIEVKQNYVYKNSKLEQTIVMHKNEPIIRVHHEVNLVDDGHMIRAEFIPTAWSDTAYSDIQFGYLGRPTTDDTEHNAAQFETCCQKWFDVSDEAQGFAVLNDAKCGFMAKQGIVSLNLVRSTVYPSIERDHVAYSYALYPHMGGFDPVALDEMAKEYNERAVYGDKVLEVPCVDNDQIDITAFKPAYDGNGYILRMFERAGKAAETKLSLPAGYVLDCEVNMLEDKIGEAPTTFAFKPFQIRSFRIKK